MLPHRRFTLAIVLIATFSVACTRDYVPEVGLDTSEVLLVDNRCDSCAIVSTDFGAIGLNTVGPTIDARLASNGTFIAVAPLRGQSAIGVFNLSGVMQRSIPLPTGWNSVAALELSPAGDLVVLSEHRSTIAAIASDGKLQHQWDVPRNTHRFATAHDVTIVNAELRTRDAIGLPLHVLTARGGIAESFGNVDPVVVPREAYEWRRKLVAAKSGRAVWSVNPQSYTLELWGVHGRERGKLLRRLARGAWWDSVSHGSSSTQFALERPRGEVIAILEDDKGLLWTQLKVASRTWKAVDSSELKRRSTMPFRLSEYDEFFETVIEVIDPVRGELVASQILPGAVGALLQGGIFAKWVQSADEEYVLHLRRLVLNGWTRP